MLQKQFTAHGYKVRLVGDELYVYHGEGEPLIVRTTELVEMVAKDMGPGDVEKWVTALIQAIDAAEATADLDTSSTYRALRLVLQGADDISFDSVDTAPEGLEECFLLDTGEAVTPGKLDELLAYDDLETLRRAALTNLRQEIAHLDAETEFRLDDDNQAGAWLIRSRSPYIAGAPLVMEDFLKRFFPDINPADGVLFALPVTNLMLLREVGYGEELARAMQILAAVNYVVTSHLRASMIISPRIYLWRDGIIEAISDAGGEDGFIIEPTPYLLDRIRH